MNFEVRVEVERCWMQAGGLLRSRRLVYQGRRDKTMRREKCDQVT